MKKKFNQYPIIIIILLGFAILSGSCKYQPIERANYPDQKIYMATADVANLGTNANGIYYVNSAAIPGQVYRYTVDLTNKKFNITLGIIRAGITLDGNVDVSVKASTDTIAKLITAGKFTAGTQILPTTAYTLTNSITVPDGKYSVTFPLAVDLNFLLNNPNKQYAIAVGISSSQRAVNPLLSTTLVFLDTSFLLPTASFTSAPDPTSTKLINFTNTSANGVAYVWDFGDGSTSTAQSPTHTYAAAGNYTVKLTTTGVTGDAQKATAIMTIVVN